MSVWLPEGTALVEAVAKWRNSTVRATPRSWNKTKFGWEHEGLIRPLDQVPVAAVMGDIVRNIHTAGWPKPTADGRGVSFSVVSGGDRYLITLAWSEGEFTYSHHEPA